MINIREYGYVGYYAMGYYSEAEECAGFVCSKDMVEELASLLKSTFYFSDLDGKHSQVQGDIVATTDTIEVLEYIQMTPPHYFAPYEQLQVDDLRFEEIKLEIDELNKQASQLNINPIPGYIIKDNKGNTDMIKW